MKYCLSYKLDKEYLKKADEISLPYNKNDDLFFQIKEINPEATIVLQIDAKNAIHEKLQDTDWNKIIQYTRACNGNLKVMTWNEEDIINAKQRNIQSFSYSIVHSFESMRSLLSLGVTDIIVGGELVHNINLLNNFTTTFRIIPNQPCVYTGIDPIVGSWIRPEDIDTINPISICQFIEQDRYREQALYRIYAEDKCWPGELNLLIKDIKNDKILNRMIPPQFQEKRSNCGWRCISGRVNCHICSNNLYLANPELYKELNNERSNSEG